MANTKALIIACLVLVCIVVSAPEAKAAITCNEVVSHLSPCISYVANGGTVPENCCNGIRSLYGLARTAADRQDVCKCLKSTISGIPYTSFNLNLAAGLPSKCGVNLPYKISPSTNCNNVK